MFDEIINHFKGCTVDEIAMEIDKDYPYLTGKAVSRLAEAIYDLVFHFDNTEDYLDA